LRTEEGFTKDEPFQKGIWSPAGKVEIRGSEKQKSLKGFSRQRSCRDRSESLIVRGNTKRHYIKKRWENSCPIKKREQVTWERDAISVAVYRGFEASRKRKRLRLVDARKTTISTWGDRKGISETQKEAIGPGSFKHGHHGNK